MMTISDDPVLSLSTTGVFIALEGDRLLPYLQFPHTLSEPEWQDWVARVSPAHPSEYLAQEAVECDRDRRIFYDPNRDWYVAGRYIAGLAVLEGAQALFTASNPLADLMVELDPATCEALDAEARVAWVGFWQTLGYDGGDAVLPPIAQPFWITQAYDGDYAALTSPDRLAEIVAGMQTHSVLERVLPSLSDAGFDAEDDLQRLLDFMQQTAHAHQWLLGLEAAT